MLILHLAYSDGSLFLWGESSFERVKRTHADSGGVSLLPWGAKPAELRTALKEIGVRTARKSKDVATEISLLLPSRGGMPLPSDSILGDVPRSEGELELKPFAVHALIIDFTEFTKLLLVARECGDRIPAPGIILADDFKYLCRALEYASAFVRRGAYIPDMELCCDSYASRWRPMILAKFQDEFAAFAKAMPPVLCGVFFDEPKAEPRTKRENASLILEWLIDTIVRASQHASSESGRRINSANPHEIWIRSLIWKPGPLVQWQQEMAVLYPQIREWADSLKAVTAQPWRLFIRVEEPMDDKDSWRLTWHLQSTQDPTLVISADRVWSPGDAERAWFSHTHTNPRRYMLQILGHLASRVPVIAESLETPFPCECRLDADELFDFLENHAASIIDQGISVQLPKAWGQLSDRPKLSVRAEVRDPQAFSATAQLGLSELLDVDWSIALGGEVLTREELETLAELKTPLTNIRGRWVVVYRDEVEKILAALKKLPQKIERREALLSSLRQDYNDAPLSEVTGSPWLDSVRALLSGSVPLEEMEAPDGFRGQLRPYQAKGLSWMARLTRLGLGACLADDMGLGKTVQTLALVKTLRDQGEHRPVLLVCPTSVMENWRREAEKFTPGTNVVIHHGTKRERTAQLAGDLTDTIVVTSYSLLHRDCSLFAKTSWAGVILDEAQNIKNPDTHQARAARSLTADWHIALTGTPVENHVGDMWSLMEFLMPGLMPNRTRFTREILRPVQAGEKKAMERVRRMTAPFILRRLKTDKEIINDLPDKIETKEFCTLCREQASLYEAVTSSLTEELAGAEGIRRRGMVLAAITALKQICDHPMLYANDKSDYRNRSGKMVRMAELAEEMLAAGDRALIFTQYAEMGAILKKFLQETFGREALFLHGGVAREKRDEMVRRFQDDENAPPFFILSLKAGGTGLNLTRANHVVMFDRWWNPAVEQQAVDRAYRIGQRSNVHVHYFCCRGTLEEKIEELIEAKKELASMLVGTGESWLTELSDSDIHELFSLEDEAVETI